MKLLTTVFLKHIASSPKILESFPNHFLVQEGKQSIKNISEYESSDAALGRST